MHQAQLYLSSPESLILLTTFSTVILEVMGSRQECPSLVLFCKGLAGPCNLSPGLICFFSSNLPSPVFEAGKRFCTWKAESSRVWMSWWLRVIFLSVHSGGWRLWVCFGAKKSGEIIYLSRLPPCMRVNSTCQVFYRHVAGKSCATLYKASRGLLVVFCLLFFLNLKHVWLAHTEDHDSLPGLARSATRCICCDRFAPSCVLETVSHCYFVSAYNLIWMQKSSVIEDTHSSSPSQIKQGWKVRLYVSRGSKDFSQS